MFDIYNVQPAQLDTIIKELPAQGTTISTLGLNSYSITGHGISATAAYDPKTEILTINITHKPFYIPESAIESGLEKALKGQS